MRTPILLLLVFAFIAGLTSCSPQIYQDPYANSITQAHNVVAIIPPIVTIKGRRNESPEHIQAAAEADIFNFQHEMYSWMLQRKRQGRMPGVQILDPETTNAKLEAAGYTIHNRQLTPSELAEVLGVDAVITSRYNTVKPMSEGVALALGLLLDNWGTTNRTSVNLSIHDRSEGMLWNYDWASSGSFTSSEALVSGLMRNASRRMPYVVR